MTITTMIIIFFAVFVLLMLVFSRNATLDKLPVIPGEKNLFEESDVKVVQTGSPQSMVFNNCLVRVTNYRIIIAQKPMMGDKSMLKHVMTYNKNYQNADQKSGFKGYLEFNIVPAEIKFVRDSKQTEVHISLPSSGLTKGQELVFSLQGLSKFKNKLKM